MSALETALEPYPYQLQLVDYLKHEEEDLWGWFASEKYLDEYAASVRQELLKTTYRFDSDGHARLYEIANAAREALEIAAPVTLYQAAGAPAMNASLAFVPGEVHIVFYGAVTSTLTEEELKAALAHELTHYALWERFDRELLAAHQLLGGIANHPAAAQSHIESARLFALYNEMHADRGALHAMNDPLPAIRSLIKIETGLPEVNAESYLRQADEIFSRERVKATQLTHPESFIRARALRIWSERQRDGFDEIARMIEGTPVLNSLDLVAQIRLSRLTANLISSLLAPKWFQTEAVLSHARKFFPDLQPGGVLADETCKNIAAMDASVQQYFTYVMLDFVTADPDLEDVPVAAVIDVSERCGVKAQMLETLAKEIALPKKRLAKIEADYAQMLAAAKRQGEAEAGG